MIRQWPTALWRSVRNSGNFILFLISKHFQRQFSLYLDFEPNETCSFVSFIRQSKHLVYTLIGIITFSKEVNIANKRCVRMDDSEQFLSPLVLTENICVQGIRWIMHMENIQPLPDPTRILNIYFPKWATVWMLCLTWSRCDTFYTTQSTFYLLDIFMVIQFLCF